MRFTPGERSGLALMLVLFGTMFVMYIIEQVTHRPASPVWQVPLGGILVLMGVDLIRFQQEIVDKRWNNWIKDHRWIGRTSDAYIDPVFSAIAGIVVILFGIFMMLRGVFALF